MEVGAPEGGSKTAPAVEAAEEIDDSELLGGPPISGKPLDGVSEEMIDKMLMEGAYNCETCQSNEVWTTTVSPHQVLLRPGQTNVPTFPERDVISRAL